MSVVSVKCEKLDDGGDHTSELRVFDLSDVVDVGEVARLRVDLCCY